MSVKRNPLEFTQKFVEQLKNRFETATDDHEREQIQERIFSIELLCLYCGWNKLSEDLKKWRESSYEKI